MILFASENRDQDFQPKKIHKDANEVVIGDHVWDQRERTETKVTWAKAMGTEVPVRVEITKDQDSLLWNPQMKGK